MSPPPDVRRSRHPLVPLVPRAALAVAIVFAAARAWTLRWTCDDAFISFRYAANLVEGRGLVFNAGERVEGYTNFAWTLAVAPALALGVRPELWTQLLGVAAFAATVAILGVIHLARAKAAGSAPLALPFAALALAFHRDAAVHAVSGLETGAFTALLVGGYAALARPGLPPRPALGAALLGAATLTRPDGIVFLGLAGAWLAARALRDRAARRDAVVFAALAGAILAAHLAFRWSYYGALVPNTYHAKSADRAWYAQGAYYLWLYVLRYPLLALAPLAFVFVAGAARRGSDRARELLAPSAFALLLGVVHVFWVVRVGGDFMSGRFLVPATPFVLVALEAALAVLAERSAAASRATPALTAGVLASFLFVPEPLLPEIAERGIVDEHAYYTPERTAATDARAAKVARYLEGLEVRMAFFGAQARTVYRLRVATAIECETGLTDTFVARQELPSRGRIGHEKHAPPSYYVGVRRAHLTFPRTGPRAVELDAYVPRIGIELGDVHMRLLHWDPALVAALRARGAIVEDFPTMLDAFLSHLDEIPRAVADAEYARARHFYFAFVDDPARERRFLERLARPD